MAADLDSEADSIDAYDATLAAKYEADSTRSSVAGAGIFRVQF